eukprot:4520132-Lingulodinium_polyedra.AAC.1
MYALTYSSDHPAAIEWLPVLDWGTWLAIPATPVPPARQFLEGGKKFAQTMGVVLRQAGPP